VGWVERCVGGDDRYEMVCLSPMEWLIEEASQRCLIIELMPLSGKHGVDTAIFTRANHYLCTILRAASSWRRFEQPTVKANAPAGRSMSVATRNHTLRDVNSREWASPAGQIRTLNYST
jgi:hypothetical protein